MGLDEPDKRLLDAEIILKFIAFRLFSKEYTGNLKLFLDNAMRKINLEWNQYEEHVKNEYCIFNLAIERSSAVNINKMEKVESPIATNNVNV